MISSARASSSERARKVTAGQAGQGILDADHPGQAGKPPRRARRRLSARRATCAKPSRPTARRSINARPFTTSVFRLGVALREAGQPARALAEFSRVLRANPNLTEAAVQRGLTLYTLGRADEALADS